MLWTYKYEAEMDTNDADYVQESGELGTFDDAKLDDMIQVHMMMIYLNCYGSNFDEGRADEDEVREEFETACKNYGIPEDKYKNFYLDAYDYRPSDPNDDSYAHDLYFSFTRMPADTRVESVDEGNIKQYLKVG